MEIEELSKKTGVDVLEWVEANLTLAQDFNWLLLAEISSGNAFFDKNGKKNKDCDIEWLKVGVKVYAYLADQEANDSWDSIRRDEMNLRASLVLNSSSETEREENLTLIELWFDSSKELSLVDVKASLSSWEGDLDLMRTLRKIKNRLAVIGRLTSEGVKLKDQTIYEWMSIKDQLP